MKGITTVMTTKAIEILKGLKDYYIDVIHTGSREISPESVTPESDDDYVLLIHPGVKSDIYQRLLTEGFSRGGSADLGSETDTEFSSWKKTLDGLVVNLIVTWDDAFFDGWVRATSLGKALNLTSKESRVILFEALLYDNWPDNLNKLGVYA